MKPSETNDRQWIFTVSQILQEVDTDNAGKWLIFVPQESIDEHWEKIKLATESGILGFQSKTSTKLSGMRYPGDALICVFTKDYRDDADIKRVREELRKLGHTQRLAYKRNKESDAHKYGSESVYFWD